MLYNITIYYINFYSILCSLRSTSCPAYDLTDSLERTSISKWRFRQLDSRPRWRLMSRKDVVSPRR